MSKHNQYEMIKKKTVALFCCERNKKKIKKKEKLKEENRILIK